MTAGRCTVTSTQLSKGRRAGVEVLEIDNGTLRLSLLPQRGMGIWKVALGGQEFGWRSPVSGPVHPSFVPIQDPSGLGWLEGFDELLCRCGLQSNGPPVFDATGRVAYPLHGRIANLPAESIEIRHDEATGQLDVIGVVHETRFLHFNLRMTSTLTIRPGEQAFTIRDEVTNLAPSATHCQLMYHYNVGLPFLGEGAEVVAPFREVAPRDARAVEGISDWWRVGPPQVGFTEQVYFSTLDAQPDGITQVLLKSHDGKIGAGIRFNVNQLPCFVLWKNCADTKDGYVVGIEPSTNLPNPRPFEIEQGRAIQLESGASAAFDLRFEFYGDERQVRNATEEIGALRKHAVPKVSPHPRSGWSPGA